jgi:hypothetical protein
MRKLSIALTVAMVVLMLEVLTSPADASLSRIVSAHHGPGYKMKHGAWLGAWSVTLSNGKKYLMYTYGSNAPPNGTVRTIGTRPAGITARGSSVAKLVANLPVSAHASRDIAAAVKIVVELQSKNRKSFANKLPGYYHRIKLQAGARHVTRIKTLVAQLTTDGRHTTGISASVSATHVLPGQPGTTSVRVTSGGALLYGYSVALSATNATVTRASGVTNGSGTVQYAHRRTSLAPPTLSATVFLPSPYTVVVNQPSAGHAYGLLSTQLGSRTSANTSYQLLPGLSANSMSYVDKTTGVSNNRLHYSNPAGVWPTIRQYLVGGRVLAQCIVGATVPCDSTIRLGDGQRIATQACLLNSAGACDGAWYQLGGQEVVSPAYPSCVLKRPDGLPPRFLCTSYLHSPRWYTIRISYGAHRIAVNLANGTTRKIVLDGYKTTKVLTGTWYAYRYSNRTGILKQVTFINRRLH